MRCRSRYYSWPRQSENGAALVIVLAFVVLVTGLVVAYFSSTVSDLRVATGTVSQTRVDELTVVATDTILSDLRQEISDPTRSTVTTVNAVDLYSPTAATLSPMRSGNPSYAGGVTNDPIPNLVRRSWAGDSNLTGDSTKPGYTSFRSLASSVNSTTDVSANGRAISLSRWNKHYLVPRPTGAAATDSTPVNTFVAPDWVILTRTGRSVFATWNSALADSTSASFAVGRYAYAIYDEGGLLDANVAGFPTNTTTTQYGLKGTEAFADLTSLGMSQREIDDIIGWRNLATAQPSGSFGNFTFDANSATRYFTSVLSDTGGFLSVGTNTWSNPGPRTNQRFLGRQSLIQLVLQLDAFYAASLGASTAFNANELQYLTTFSRELNAPSWTPTQDASSLGGSNGASNIYAYSSNREAASAVNRNLPNVRAAGAFTRADGTSAASGDYLINRRFPLTRIGGLGSTGLLTSLNTTVVNGVAAPASATTVQRDFGLVWNNGTSAWDYVGANGAAVQTTIETLDSVASEKREPNFFELLKATILSGSVGLGSGPGNTFVASDARYYSTTTANPLSSDLQIMQIGANIIDQWDRDNVPTFIRFNGNEVAGIENLPYLNKLIFKPSWDTVKVKGQPQDQFSAWLLPSLWNPHQTPPGSSADIRVAMTAGAMSSSITYTLSGTLQSNTLSGGNTQYMTVASASFTNSPSPPTAIVSAPGGSAISQSPDGYYGFGFTFPGPGGPVTPANAKTAYPDFGPAVSGGAGSCVFEMQIQVGTNWKTYQKWNGCGPNHPLVFNPVAQSDWSLKTLHDPEYVVLDPRTMRFGVWGNDGKSSNVAADYTTGGLTTLDTGVSFEAITSFPPQGSSFASSSSPNLYLYSNNADPAVHYNDLDGVQRRGDATTTFTTAMVPSNAVDRPFASPLPMPNPAVANSSLQSVAELGQVFRDQPWKTLNLSTSSSADAGLLDVFTLHESSMEGGKTSLNTRQTPVLTAILSQAAKRLTGTNGINSSERDAIISALTALTTAQPMLNKAELVTRLAADSSVTGLGNKEAREAVIRAFSDATQTRTWNLLIDVVAQSGRYAPSAATSPNAANPLANFLVEGEQRYWVHVAIDRFSGEVIDRQIEVVKD